MYLDGFTIAIAVMVFMVMGAAGNEFARWLVKKINDESNYEFDERLGR